MPRALGAGEGRAGWSRPPRELPKSTSPRRRPVCHPSRPRATPSGPRTSRRSLDSLVQVLVHFWVQLLVLFLQRFMIRRGGVSAASLIMRALDFSETALEHQTSTTLAFVSFVDSGDGP